jgi:hypothetical protein
MTTALAFMIARVEGKIEYPEVLLTETVAALKYRLIGELQKRRVDVQTADQIRLIYCGRILRDADAVSSFIKTELEPPYTLQVLIRPENASSDDPKPVEPIEVRQVCCACLLC